jgi:5-methylcytosine-specific restriction endonuclease McrA
MRDRPTDPKVLKQRQQWRDANDRRKNGTQIPMAEYRARLSAQSAERREKQRAESAAAGAERARLRQEATTTRREATRAERLLRSKAQQKAWREANRDRMRELMRRWKKANPEKVRADRRGRCGKSNERRRTALMKMQKGRCGYCRCKLVPGKIHIDHVMPKALGGSNRRSNLQLLCETCNLQKHAQHPVDFARSIGRLI